MKALRELTKKEFKRWKKIFFWLSIAIFVYYIFFTRYWLSEYLALAGALVALGAWAIFKRHELYDGEFKDELELKEHGKWIR